MLWGLRHGVIAFGCVGALLLSGCGQAGQFSADDPRSAVNQLLIATIAQANGQRACALLTERERERFDNGPAGSCRQAFNNSISSMPGPYGAAEDAGRPAEDLTFEVVRRDGNRATVIARKRKNAALSFDLVQLTPAEREADDVGREGTIGGSAPDSSWRVAAGAEQLLTVEQ